MTEENMTMYGHLELAADQGWGNQWRCKCKVIPRILALSGKEQWTLKWASDLYIYMYTNI